jgi:hypothetical protein
MPRSFPSASSLEAAHRRERFRMHITHAYSGVAVSWMLRRVKGPPLETEGSSPFLVSPGVQPIQASPCVQDLRHFILHPFGFSRFTDMLLSPLGFSARLVSCPKRFFALDLLLLWSNLMCAEAAHDMTLRDCESGIAPKNICLGATGRGWN